MTTLTEEKEAVVDAPFNVPSYDAQIGLKEKAINLRQGNYLCPLASCYYPNRSNNNNNNININNNNNNNMKRDHTTTFI